MAGLRELCDGARAAAPPGWVLLRMVLLQAAAVLAGLLLHAGAAKLGLVPAIWAAAAVGSPAALTGAAPQHAVDLDDCALARRAWRAVVDGGRRVVRLLRLVRGREDRELAVRQGQRRRAA